MAIRGSDPGGVPSATFRETPQDPTPGWLRTDLKRPRAVLTLVAGTMITAPAALFVSCNVHEIAHGLVATLLGWRVERVNLCLPAGGNVVFSTVPGVRNWTWFAVGFAGGLIAAAFLIAVYLLVFARSAKPLRAPGWWGAGLGVVLWVGPQILIGLLEGIAEQRGEDYTDYLGNHPAVFLPLVGCAVVAGIAAYTWRWRSVWRTSADDRPFRTP